MRTFELPPPSSFCPWNQCDITPRGVCVMAIEFLTRYSTSECVVTRGDWELWGCVFDLFPKTLFHAFGGFTPGDLRPNVIHHGAPFCQFTACKYAKRGTQYNLIFCGENMAVQSNLYKCGSPTAALMWITDPTWGYLSGEFLYPVHSGISSSLCALVPCHHQMHPPVYTGLGMHMRNFQNFVRYPGRSYDRDAEVEILLAHARSVSGLSDMSTAMLMVDMVRLDLPREDQPLLVFPIADQPLLDFHIADQPMPVFPMREQPLLVFPIGEQACAEPCEEILGQVHERPNHQVVQHDHKNHTSTVWSREDIENLLAQFLS